MGWSIGVATVLALLAHPQAMPKEYYSQLDPYLRSIVMYDPPYFAFGYELDGEVDPYNPWTDPNIKTHEERYRIFQYWVSSYYDHLDITSGSMSGLDYRHRTEQASIDSMSPEELSLMYEEAAAVRAELHMVLPPMQSTVNAQAKRALFDESLAQTVLPELQVVHIVCMRTHWHCMWGHIQTRKKYEAHVARGEKVRLISSVQIPQGNHFVSLISEIEDVIEVTGFLGTLGSPA
ncbi:hypothetical protein GLOTRDRAFT_39020 [Gloeophyllum trabeum ATCC 11539]|uniref:Uncharacterized protein n=1 Tax=Gloeophyllum trabeum (strain ATCC 11539 / FP-39264 / Madison 617) TaxID=670483 RepID=S7QCZ3_GLOTA|nr:uncharacterized protein GLOTRDRAFT_39020 [Gloeophyllum trabeum ATCC 11539]EPQ57222.1 hypothetical protein GLOTRDRAFT_39020 [Gloeophyllum trabeum ATCC 11539]